MFTGNALDEALEEISNIAASNPEDSYRLALETISEIAKDYLLLNTATRKLITSICDIVLGEEDSWQAMLEPPEKVEWETEGPWMYVYAQEFEDSYPTNFTTEDLEDGGIRLKTRIGTASHAKIVKWFEKRGHSVPDQRTLELEYAT